MEQMNKHKLPSKNIILGGFSQVCFFYLSWLYKIFLNNMVSSIILKPSKYRLNIISFVLFLVIPLKICL